ncbi:MAG: methyltransferase [Pseudomonadota bacterium]
MSVTKTLLNSIQISLDETHHLIDGKPLYETRFQRVMSFHYPPGYAPVENNGQSKFIDIQGKNIFQRQFKKAFGFYGGIATVADERGFFHIDVSGQDIYQKRYAWAGNYQEGACVVRDQQGSYFHINQEGKPFYSQKYLYVGDYKYGIAVVINDSGLSTHIDKQGELIHGMYFEELDVYHKGFAIAKDSQGYFHIDKQGKEIYQARYAKLEPFYNGQAVAVTHDGIKIIISETGLVTQTIDSQKIKINKIKHKFAHKAFEYWDSRILAAILEIGVLEQLVTGKTKHELYEATNLPVQSLNIILSWLQLHGFISIQSDILSLTLKAKTILEEVKEVFLYWQGEAFNSSCYLLESLISHRESFSKIYQSSFFDYVENNEVLKKRLSSVMTFYGNDYEALIKPLNLFKQKVCDIGGGNGVLIKQLQSHYPNIQAIILDRYCYIQDKNITFIETDFFSDWQIDADIFIMSRILHDWNDQQAIALLAQVAKNMSQHTRLYLFETLLPEEPIKDKGITVSFHLLNSLGSRERTLSELTELATQAGLKIIKVQFPEALISLITLVKK